MKHISNSIQDLLVSGEFADQINGWRAVELWADVVGENVAGRSSAVGFTDGTLHVEVVNSAWVQELSFLRRKILKQLNAKLGKDVVTSIKFALSGGGMSGRGRRG